MQVRGTDLVGGRIVRCQRGTNNRSVHWRPYMDRIFLIVMCASIILLTTAFGLAVNHENVTQRVPLFLRMVPS
jgi:hypothetical protein